MLCLRVIIILLDGTTYSGVYWILQRFLSHKHRIRLTIPLDGIVFKTIFNAILLITLRFNDNITFPICVNDEIDNFSVLCIFNYILCGFYVHSLKFYVFHSPGINKYPLPNQNFISVNLKKKMHFTLYSKSKTLLGFTEIVHISRLCTRFVFSGFGFRVLTF